MKTRIDPLTLLALLREHDTGLDNDEEMELVTLLFKKRSEYRPRFTLREMKNDPDFLPVDTYMKDGNLHTRLQCLRDFDNYKEYR